MSDTVHGQSLSAVTGLVGSGEPILCHWCNRAYKPRQRNQAFCCPKCSDDAYNSAHPVRRSGIQTRLVLDPPSEPIQPLDVGPTTAQVQAAQAKQTVKVLGMLQEAGTRGVSTGDFLEAHIGRFSARIGELRAVKWRIRGVRESEHAWRFVLEGRS